MKSYLLAAIFFVISLFLLLALRIFYYPFDDYSLVFFIALATLLGLAFGRINQLKKDLQDLRSILAKDWEMRRNAEQTTQSQQSLPPSSPSSEEKIAGNVNATSLPLSTKTAQLSKEHHDNAQDIKEISGNAKQTVLTSKALGAKQLIENPLSSLDLVSSPNLDGLQHSEAPSDKINPMLNYVSKLLKRYFTGGNLFVRIGILILFFGVAFLLKYASERVVLPVEYRLIFVAIAAIALLLLGWRLREKNINYSLLLQGTAIGIFYLNIFAAFNLYQLLPALIAFILLFLISIFAASLAVLQNARSLAIFGFLGGFLAPILASSGSGDYIALFSYYLFLNIAIVIVAWFKAWRELNLLGFVFTSAVATVWGLSSYQSENYIIVQIFLIIFFFLYVLLVVLFALKQPASLRGYVDGSLLFGVPLMVSGLQYGLVKEFTYGIAISTFALAVVYLFIASYLWKYKGKMLKLLSEAFLMLGIIFSSLTIPFAVAPTHTAAAWALEGLGLLWLGSRQNRLSVRCFALLLQVAAGWIFYVSQTNSEGILFINSAFISMLMISLSGIISARILYSSFPGRLDWELSKASNVLLVWGLLWLFAGVSQQINVYLGYQYILMGLLLLSSLVSSIFMVLARYSQSTDKQAWAVSIGLLPMMVLLGLLSFIFSIGETYPFKNGGWVAWPSAFLVIYSVLYQIDKYHICNKVKIVLHSFSALMLVFLISWQGGWNLLAYFSTDSDWIRLWLLMPTAFALWIIIRAKLTLITNNRSIYYNQIAVLLCAYMVVWLVLGLIRRGETTPLPWLPLINPIDIGIGLILISIYYWWRKARLLPSSYLRQHLELDTKVVIGTIFILFFVWLNFTWLRIAHHWFSVDYHIDSLYHSDLVQTVLTILWALLGVIMTVFASQRQRRNVWLIGSAVLAIVVLKLFIIDLSELGHLSRIIAFLIVGVLLISIGYFAPLPERNKTVGDSYATKK